MDTYLYSILRPKSAFKRSEKPIHSQTMCYNGWPKNKLHCAAIIETTQIYLLAQLVRGTKMPTGLAHYNTLIIEVHVSVVKTEL